MGQSVLELKCSSMLKLTTAIVFRCQVITKPMPEWPVNLFYKTLRYVGSFLDDAEDLWMLKLCQRPVGRDGKQLRQPSQCYS